MTIPRADGPDIYHGQTITGEPVDPGWSLFSHKCSEGRSSGDPKFVERWDWAHTQGFRYNAAYHWLRSDSTIADQANNFLTRVGKAGGIGRGDFVQLDWEVTPNIPLPTSLHAAEWADRIEQTLGREAVITYTGSWLPDSTLDSDLRREFVEWREENPTRPLWLAFYNTADGGGWKACAETKAVVWQYTSSYMHPSIYTPRLKPDGTTYRAGFDMNHVFDFATLDRLTAQTPTPPTPPPPPEDDMRYVIIDQRLGGAAYFAETLKPVGDELVAAMASDPTVHLVTQDHEQTTTAFLGGLDAASVVAYERFRVSHPA